jgi:chitinase
MKKFLPMAAAFLLGWGATCAAATAQRPILVGYVFPQNKIYQPGDVDAKKLDRVNYAFAAIQDGRMVLGLPSDPQNLVFLTALRRENPGFKVLVSVGGWLGSKGFSDMSLTRGSRQVFIASAMEFLSQYDLDGLDIDWEYPGMEGAGNPFRPEDKQNFTLLVKELRQAFDHKEKTLRRHLYLSVAAGSGQDFLDHTEMRKVQRYLDTVNLMTYDFVEPSETVPTGHHAPLYTDPAEPRGGSTDASVQAYVQAGVPASKILLGLPFYGHVWGEVPDANHGLHQHGKPIPNIYAQYSRIEAEMLGQGYTRYWDEKAGVPWLYNAEKRIFVTYEDPESLRAKCRYVLSKKLGGAMFWDYESDEKGVLRTAAWQTLHAETGEERKQK